MEMFQLMKILLFLSFLEFGFSMTLFKKLSNKRIMLKNRSDYLIEEFSVEKHIARIVCGKECSLMNECSAYSIQDGNVCSLFNYQAAIWYHTENSSSTDIYYKVDANQCPIDMIEHKKDQNCICPDNSLPDIVNQKCITCKINI